MLDKIEYGIARKLAEHHHYPYGQEIYINIFKNFSHFPLNLKDLEMNGIGNTITFLALVILNCFQQKKSDFLSLYKNVLRTLNDSAAAKLRYNLTVETFLGCVLYFYHPVNIKNILTSVDVEDIFNEKERYEYEIKKKTILLYTI
jgi:hypothetical protein